MYPIDDDELVMEDSSGRYLAIAEWKTGKQARLIDEVLLRQIVEHYNELPELYYLRIFDTESWCEITSPDEL